MAFAAGKTRCEAGPSEGMGVNAGEGEDPLCAPPRRVMEALGIVGLLVDHKDGTLFVSDIFSNRDEATQACEGLVDRFVGLAAIVPL